MSVAGHGSGQTGPAKLIIPASAGIVGGAAGFTVRAAANTALATCAASQTAATFVIPVYGLTVGRAITGFSLVGQIESAGNTATVDAALWKHTAAAADVAAAVASAVATAVAAVVATAVVAAVAATVVATVAATVAAAEAATLAAAEAATVAAEHS